MGFKRPAALGLCIIGASALPGARVAFLQRGVADGEAPVLKTQGTGGVLTPRQLSTAVSRVLSLDSNAEVTVSLPYGDIFNRPDDNLMLFVDGLLISGSKQTPFISKTMRASDGSAYHLNMPTERDESKGSVLHGTLGGVFDVPATAGSSGSFSTVSCGSVDTSLFESQACSGAPRLSTPQFTKATASSLGLSVVVDSSQKDLWTLKVDEKSASSVTYDASNPDDSAFLGELALLASLNSQAARRKKAGPGITIVYLSSLRGLIMAHGEHDAKVRVSSSILDAAVERSLDLAVAGTKPRRLTAQLVVGPYLKDMLPHKSKVQRGTRRLQFSEDAAAEIVSISQYQLNLWTGVFLALAVYLAIYGIACMDLPRDSLLYAKFGLDSSGSKND